MNVEIDKRAAGLAYRILLQVYKDPGQNYLKNQEDFDSVVGLLNELMVLRREKEAPVKKKRKQQMIVDILSELMTIRAVYNDLLTEVEDFKLKIEKLEKTHTIKLNEKTAKQISDQYTEFRKWHSRLNLMWKTLVAKEIIRE